MKILLREGANPYYDFRGLGTVEEVGDQMNLRILNHPRGVLVVMIALFAVTLAVAIFVPSLYGATFGHNSHVFQAGSLHFKLVHFSDNDSNTSFQRLTYQSHPCWYDQ